MPEPRDPLRALWEAVEAPPAHRALADEDADTRAAVDWLQRAFAAARPARIPAAPAPRRRAGPRLFAALAAAAALLLAARVLLRPETPPLPLPPVAEGGAPAAPERPGPAAVPAAAPAVELLASDPTRVEMRSGSVRLILLHPPPDPNT